LASLFALGGCSKNDAPAGADRGPFPSATPTSSTAPAASSAPAAPDTDAPLFHPERATEEAPATFKAKFVTTKGDFVIAVTRTFAPHGADRFYNLVKLGYYDGVRFHRAIAGFMVQFGVNGDPRVSGPWSRATIADDPVVKSNKRGFVTFAMAGKDSRTTQVFINYDDKNSRLDKKGFAPFGEVVEGMKVVDALYKEYGELAPRGKGPDPSLIQTEGNAYLEKEFPALDWIKEAKIL